MRTRERPPADHEVRERVAREVDVPTVLEAGAGSGKTTVILDRLVEIVVSGRAPISRVAAITFTRAAAASLRLRLRERLEELVAGGPHVGRDTTAEQRRLAAAALDGLDGAPISTIHSFCLRLLAERPVEAGIEPGSGMLDEHGQTELLRSAWRAFLLELEADPQRRAELLALRAAGLAEPSWAADEDDDRLFAAAVAIARNRDLRPFADPSPADLAPATKRFRRLRDELRACLDRCIDADKGALDAWRDNLAVLDALAGPDESACRGRIGAWADKPPLAVRRGQQGAYRPAGTLARMREIVDETKAALEEAARALRAELHGRVIRLLAADDGPSFLRTYARVKREAAALDFQDLLLGARRLLADPAGPRRDLAERYPYLLIDEFQDTDPVQVEIAELLAGMPGPPGAAPETAGALFVVGDPRQSIYRFRRADLASYVRFAQGLARRGGRRERLAVGFRNAPALLRWINGTFASLFGGTEEGEASDVSAYAPIAPHRGETAGPSVHVLPLPEGAGGTAAEDADLEARLVANLLHGWFRDAPPLVVEDAGTSRPCRPGDVMVVVRRTARLDAFREAFSRRGIPASFEGGRGFFGRGEVQALLAGLRSVLDPADDLSVASALRSVLVGATDPVIAEWALADRPRGGTANDGDAADPIAQATARFARLHELAQSASPGEVVRETLASFRLPDALRLMRDGEARANNVEKVAALAADFVEPGLDSLRVFVREFERRVETNAAEPDLTLDDPADVVQVTTIHRAKGLERPIVVLADARAAEPGGADLVPQREPGGAPGSLLVAVGKLVPPGWEEALAGEEREQSGEARRLLYVACTRARDHLVVVTPRPSTSAGTFVAPLLPHLPDPSRPGRSTMHGAEVEVLDPLPLDAALPAAQPPVAERDLPAAREPAPAPAPRHPALADALRRPLPIVDLPVTTLAATQAVPAPPSSGGRGRAFGALVHRLLECADERFGPPPRAVAETLAGEAGAEPSDVGPALDAVRRIALHELVQRAGHARRCFRELPVAAPLADPAAGVPAGTPPPEALVVHGVVDLAFEEPDGWVLVDYKTDPCASAADRAARAAHYAPQLRLYAEALAAAGLAVKETHLLFVDDAPD